MADKLTASEAIWALAGWLSCRDTTLKVGAKHNCVPLVDAVAEFVQANELKEPTEGWEVHIVRPGIDEDH